MKKIFTFLTLCTVGFLYSAPLKDHQIDPQALHELTIALEIPADADVVQETQKRWLRKPGQERWEMQELSDENKTFVLDWASSQGLYSAWTPSQHVYDKALILGATTCRMQLRLNHLVNLWNKGVRFKEIVWLLGARPLDKKIDSLTDRCSTEAQAAHILWEEYALPEELKHLPVSFIEVPMKEHEGVLLRPNTQDTIVAWLEVAPTPCTALFVSDQPFCGYQFAVIKHALPDAFAFDVVGSGVDPKSHPASAAITLDSLARWLYEESLNHK